MSPPDRPPRPPRLFPSQVCFVVDDVPSAAEDCVARFGWGPFQQFTAPVDEAEYRGWTGRKVTDVALGMAGNVQVELIHVHEGRDPVADYQAEYGIGFQHLGVGCRSRDAALAHLVSLGASPSMQTEFTGIRIAFVDIPTGPAMFELLEATQEKEDAPEVDAQTASSNDARTSKNGSRRSDARIFEIDRATIVTRDLEAALSFYSQAFGWSDAKAARTTLRHPDGESEFGRSLGRAGTLELELLEPTPGASDPYARHLERGEHGLVHAGGPWIPGETRDTPNDFEWLTTGECFSLEDWAGGEGALQRRSEDTSREAR